MKTENQLPNEKYLFDFKSYALEKKLHQAYLELKAAQAERDKMTSQILNQIGLFRIPEGVTQIINDYRCEDYLIQKKYAD